MASSRSDDRPDVRPSFLASVGGYLRPGHDTAREGAAGSTTLVGLAGVALVVAVVWVLRSRVES